jgi:hypothetical protein
VYLYRAVEFSGARIDFLLSAKRDAAAAERFLAKNLARREPSGAAEALEENCRPRPVLYLNNVLEQDHRRIKRRVRASQHFRSFWGAWHTIAGYEAIHMIPKGQACWSAGAKVPVYCTASFSVRSLRRAKFQIIYPELQLDYSCHTFRIATPAVPAIIHFEEIP